MEAAVLLRGGLALQPSPCPNSILWKRICIYVHTNIHKHTHAGDWAQGYSTTELHPKPFYRFYFETVSP